MFPLSIRMNIQTLFVIFVLSSVHCEDRKIIATLNPGRPNCTEEHTLVYIRELGPKDTIHQLWDFTDGIPTMLFAIGPVNSSITVLWEDMKPEKFVFSHVPSYSFAAAFDKLCEYDDIEDKGRYDGNSPQKCHSLRHVSWRLNDSVTSGDEAMIRVHGLFKDAWRKGFIEMKLDLLGYSDFSADLPHLIHTVNSTLVDVALVNLTASPNYNASRYALHFVLVSTDPESSSMEYKVRQSLDDEHTPGVFEIVEIKTPRSVISSDGGFIQFRPVGYKEHERSVSTSTNAHIVSKFNRTSLPSHSTLVTFYKDWDQSNLLVQAMFISFGETGDGYYKQHNYTAWSFTLGYGQPPLETFSLFITMVICIGLGVPILMAVTTIVVMFVRKVRNTRSEENYNVMDN